MTGTAIYTLLEPGEKLGISGPRNISGSLFICASEDGEVYACSKWRGPVLLECGVIVTKGGMDATDAKGVKVACQRE